MRQVTKLLTRTLLHGASTYALFLICSCQTTLSSSQTVNERESSTGGTVAPVSFSGRLELPLLAHSDNLIEHTGFTLVYNTHHRNAQWVAYELTREKTIRGVERTDKFIADPKLPEVTALDKDYYKSGYDRGHLAPAADMSWSETAMKESFYFSNISPQVPSFNRGVWKRLEDQVRWWAAYDSTIYVVTGPVLRDNLPTIGPNQVSVPELFYKVILVYKPHEKKGIGFIMKNEGSSLPVKNFAISIDSVQRATGINFFPLLSEDEAENLEQSICISCWNWK